MIDFPNSPTVGQVVTSPNGTAWRWTGSTWLLGTAASAGGARGRVAYAVQASVAGVTTLIDLMSVTFTASPNRTYRTTVFVHPSSTVTNDDLVVTINDGGGAQVQFAYAPYLDPAVSSTMSVSVVETGLSGTITRKARGGRQAGTGTLTFYSAPTSPAFILVEDITYDAGPGGAAGTPGLDAAWMAYTPTVGNYPLGASAGVTARYLQFGPSGKTIMVYTLLGINAAYGGTGAITFSPPFPLRGTNAYDKAIMGNGSLAKGGNSYLLTPFATGATVGLTYLIGAAAANAPVPSGLIDNSGALKLAAGDYLFFTYTAEIA